MNLDDAVRTFLHEARDLLENMEAALLACHESPPDEETVNGLFRAAHTIKGSAGLFCLDDIVTFTHAVEGVLDGVRSNKIDLDVGLVGLLLSCADHIRSQVDAVEAGSPPEGGALQETREHLIDELRKYCGPSSGPTLAPVGFFDDDPLPVVASPARSAAERDAWHISLRFGRDVFRHGKDPLSFLRHLRELGTITALETLPDAIPDEDRMDPQSCYLGFEVAFHGHVDKEALEHVFELPGDDCQLRILPPQSRVEDFVALIKQLPEEPLRLGEILARCGLVTSQEIEAALTAQRAGPTSGPPPRIGDILVEQGSIQPAAVEAALVKQQQVRTAKAQETRSVRVDADKLDELINLVGELITATAGTKMAARRTRMTELLDSATSLSNLVEAVRDSALQLRMVKIGSTFTRFQRLVHDVSRELGKDIRLMISGEDAELDKTVVERIGDPLTHLVRNAMDHGIEPREIRLARGKPERATVHLNAYHDSGSIVIEVSDDGGGLPRARIYEKAVERGLIEPGKELTDDELCRLIFEPGFSTASMVTNLSGRGVGMDVVKRNITALRGTVAIASTEEVGTTVTVRLPLTLAIINGFLVGVGEATFVVPMEAVEECVEFAPEPWQPYLDLRGQALPCIRLREIFAVRGQGSSRQSVVIVRVGTERVGLVVDGLLGEAQMVIKPLGKLFQHLRWISGSSILGTGEVALILDVPALIHRERSAATPEEARQYLERDCARTPRPALAE